MRYAVFLAKGSQFKVSEGDRILVDKLKKDKGGKLQFKEVLLYVDGEDVRLGRPYLEGAVVQASVLAQEKGKKLNILKYKAKSRYRRRMGHRAKLTRLNIEKITI